MYFFGIIALFLYFYNSILDIMRIAIFSYYSFRLAVIKYWTHKLLTLNLNLLKSNKYTQRILHVITGVNEGWLVFEKVIPFSSLFGIIRSNTFWLGMWLIYKITVYHNFLGVHMLYKSLYGREVEASQTWLCSNQLWSMGKKKKKKNHVWSPLVKIPMLQV